MMVEAFIRSTTMERERENGKILESDTAKSLIAS